MNRQTVYDYVGVIRARLDALAPNAGDVVSPEETAIRRYALAMVTFLDITNPAERKQTFDRCVELGALTIPRAGFINALYVSLEVNHA